MFFRFFYSHSLYISSTSIKQVYNQLQDNNVSSIQQVYITYYYYLPIVEPRNSNTLYFFHFEFDLFFNNCGKSFAK